MQQVIAHRAMQVRTVVQCVHLVDPHALEPLRVRLDGVEHRDRFAVRQGHDEVSAVVDVTEDGVRTPSTGGCPHRGEHRAGKVVELLMPLRTATIWHVLSSAPHGRGPVTRADDAAPQPADDALAGSTVVLRDGSSVAVVAMQATDSDRLMRFHGTLSPETTYSRFFLFHPELTAEEVHRFTHVDHRDREALVAVVGDEIVGVARFDRLDDPEEAEVAFVVADSWQGRGIGSLLLERLAAAAVEGGVRRFVAETLAQNRRMLTVFRHAGLPSTERVEQGVVRVTLQLRTERV